MSQHRMISQHNDRYQTAPKSKTKQKMLPDETTATGNQTHFKSYKCNEIWLFCCSSWGHIDMENSIYLFSNVENQFFTLGRHDWKSGRHQWCTGRGSYFVVGCHLGTLFFFSFHLTISSHPSSHPSATLSLSLSHTPPPAVSLFLIHFSCFNLFSLLHLQWFTVTCPPPVPFCECITRFFLSFVVLAFPRLSLPFYLFLSSLLLT